MKIFGDLFSFSNKPSIDEVVAYVHKLPRSIVTSSSFDVKTGIYVIKIVKIDGKDVEDLVISEVKNKNEIIGVVNNLLFDYLDIPEKIRINLPKAFPVDIEAVEALEKNGTLAFAR